MAVGIRKVMEWWDRGFFGTARCYPYLNTQLTPKFLAGRNQFTAAELLDDMRICRLRYTCEVAFSRLTNEACLKDVVDWSMLWYLGAMVHWGHANVNLRKPLQQ